MAQVRATVILNVLPSGSGETVTEVSDEMVVLLEGVAQEYGNVVACSWEAMRDDEVIVASDADETDEIVNDALVDGYPLADATPNDLELLARAVNIGRTS